MIPLQFARNERWPLKTELTFKNLQIVSFEKGNCNRPDADRYVCAIVVQAFGVNIKAIVKGKTAKMIYDLVFKYRELTDTKLMLTEYILNSKTRISFTGNIREFRTKQNEIVIDNIKNIKIDSSIDIDIYYSEKSND